MHEMVRQKMLERIWHRTGKSAWELPEPVRTEVDRLAAVTENDFSDIENSVDKVIKQMETE